MLSKYSQELKQNWTTNWTPQVRNQLLASIVILLTIVYFSPIAFNYFEHRETSPINDPILALITPRNFSVLIFALIYSGLLASIIHHIKSPTETIQWIQTYTILITFRMLCIFLLPISGSEIMIPLVDPIVDSTIGSNQTLTKDLFFSGHTSTAFLYFLMARNKTFKKVLLVNCIAIAILLIWQHVHYTIDVIVAPIFAFTALWIQLRLTPIKALKASTQL